MRCADRAPRNARPVAPGIRPGMEVVSPDTRRDARRCWPTPAAGPKPAPQKGRLFALVCPRRPKAPECFGSSPVLPWSARGSCDGRPGPGRGVQPGALPYHAHHVTGSWASSINRYTRKGPQHRWRPCTREAHPDRAAPAPRSTRGGRSIGERRRRRGTRVDRGRRSGPRLRGRGESRAGDPRAIAVMAATNISP